MTHEFEKEFFLIVDQIIQENKSLDDWDAIASCDMFQEGNYVGGFESTEMEFTFSYYSNDDEYWFQLSLDEMFKVKNGELRSVLVRPAEL